VTFRGQVRNGTVVLDDPSALPDGTPVTVRPLKPKAPERRAGRNGSRRGARQPTLLERLAPVVGKAKHLARDMAENHDHYLYGVAKRPSRKKG
jgi:hypothetical protein